MLLANVVDIFVYFLVVVVFLALFLQFSLPTLNPSEGPLWSFLSGSICVLSTGCVPIL